MKSESPDTWANQLIDGISWVWLDLDDTLIDFHANSAIALSLLYERCGLKCYFRSEEEWKESYYVHNKLLWEQYNRGEITQSHLRLDRFVAPLKPKWTSSLTELEELSREMDPLYLDLLAEQTNMIPGAVDLLKHLRARDYNIGVLSNGFTDVQHKKLRVNGLDSLIDIMVLSDDIGVNKPDTRLYEYAMSKVHEPDPGRHIMIGENPDTDIKGAIDAGWKAILLDPSAPEGLSAADRHAVTSSLTKITHLF